MDVSSIRHDSLGPHHRVFVSALSPRMSLRTALSPLENPNNEFLQPCSSDTLLRSCENHIEHVELTSATQRHERFLPDENPFSGL